MVAKQLFTIGYEGAEFADFVATLLVCGVTRVLDVRDVPISRKRGFSKNVLQQNLRSKGIDYVHLKGLGDPKSGREAARRGDFPTFRRIYSSHLETPDALLALEDARILASNRVSCLLCFERDNQHCHRSMVADRLAYISEFKIRHIGICVGIGANRKTEHGQTLREFTVR